VKADAYLFKPFTLDDLLEQVQRVIKPAADARAT
jgi:DNA-binding response OmpR family regulator